MCMHVIEKEICALPAYILHKNTHTLTQIHTYTRNPNIFETAPRQEVVRVLGNIFNKQASETHGRKWKL